MLLISPLLLLVLCYGLVYVSFRYTGLARPSHLEVAGTFWEEPEGLGLQTGKPTGRETREEPRAPER